MLFWIIAAGVVAGSLGLVLGPLLRGRETGERRASYDMQVYRDQLREIELDLSRGVLTPEEAETTRIEVSRKLLAAADAEAAQTAADAAPRRLSRAAAAGLVGLLVLAAALLYSVIGAPQMPDQPREQRLARLSEAFANRYTQAEAEALIAERGLAPTPAEPNPEGEELVARLQSVLADAAPDARRTEGYRLLVRSLAGLQRYDEAHVAQATLIESLGADSTAADRIDLAELMILAANGYVSPEAEAALRAALAEDPTNPRGRYYSGLMLAQAGRADLAYPLWSTLLAQSPRDAPWVPLIEAQIDEVARAAGLPPVAAARGPSAADVEAAADMTAEERGAMIAGMVDALGTRLAEEGGPPADWAQLIRALGVLGRADEASAIWTEAQSVFAGDDDSLALVRGAAEEAGLVP